MIEIFIHETMDLDQKIEFKLINDQIVHHFYEKTVYELIILLNDIIRIIVQPVIM